MSDLRALLERAIQDALRPGGAAYYPVIRKRFGLGTTYGQTLEELAVEAQCTRERVRQVEQQALKQLPAGVPVDLTELADAITRSNRTYDGATRAAQRLLGDDVWLPGLAKLAQCFDAPLPPYGFGELAKERGLDAKSAWQLVELRSMQKVALRDVTRWMRPPGQKDYEDAPAWAVSALVRDDAPSRVEDLPMPDWLAGLSQPDQIRALMLRTGFTRAQMMEALRVQRSAFDRWLWPADNPVPMPPAVRALFVSIARMSGGQPRPRNRRLGANKDHNIDGIPGCARRSRSRETGVDLSLHRTKQSQLYGKYDGPWVVVCEAHRLLVEVESFSAGLEAMAHPTKWCPKCAELAPAPKVHKKKARGTAPRKNDV